jgi:hypothetical protein
LIKRTVSVRIIYWFLLKEQQEKGGRLKEEALEEFSFCRLNCYDTNLSKNLPGVMTTEDVIKALGRYTSEESDWRTAAVLGIRRATLRAWLEGGDPPDKFTLARVAGFLRRVGYL